jgi:hypothetical protein
MEMVSYLAQEEANRRLNSEYDFNQSLLKVLFSHLLCEQQYENKSTLALALRILVNLYFEAKSLLSFLRY